MDAQRCLAYQVITGLLALLHPEAPAILLMSALPLFHQYCQKMESCMA